MQKAVNLEILKLKPTWILSENPIRASWLQDVYAISGQDLITS